jgi:hypothetical protein
MRKLLNTLHVMTQGAYVHRDGETIAIKVGQELKLRVPIHTLEGLVCWGQVSCSPPVLGLCCERGVGISFGNYVLNSRFFDSASLSLFVEIFRRRGGFCFASGLYLRTTSTILSSIFGGSD